MQLSQGLGMKLLIESMRIRKPQTTTTYFYKLTENYPSCSWATLDYYGVPKRSHYDVREAYAPVHVMALFEEWSSPDDHLALSVHAANDTAAPVEAALTIRLFDGGFNVVEAETLDVAIPVDRAIRIADKNYALPPNFERPLFLCLDLTGDQGLIDRNWYYFDFADRRGTLFERPRRRWPPSPRESGPVGVDQNIGDNPLSVE
jgi:beta-mannosidase